MLIKGKHYFKMIEINKNNSIKIVMFLTHFDIYIVRVCTGIFEALHFGLCCKNLAHVYDSGIKYRKKYWSASTVYCLI